MAKILVIVLGLLVAYWLLKRYRKGLTDQRDRSQGDSGENMVRCARCGLHLPRSESIVADTDYFCCSEHKRQHQQPDR
ncbi:MAG: PP0621 family protein [Betaproteobacteria bacterium]|nr:PP0621 family protein [Betaproteobacteria bacterium]